MEINTEYTTHGTARNTGYPALFPACFFLGKYRTYLYLQYHAMYVHDGYGTYQHIHRTSFLGAATNNHRT